MRSFLIVLTVLVIGACAKPQQASTARSNILVAAPNNLIYSLNCLQNLKDTKGTTLTEAEAAKCKVDEAALTAYNQASSEQKRNLYYYNWYYTAYLPNYGYGGVSNFCNSYFGSSSCMNMNPTNYTYQTNNCRYQVAYSGWGWYTPYQSQCSWNNNTYNNGWYYWR